MRKLLFAILLFVAPSVLALDVPDISKPKPLPKAPDIVTPAKPVIPIESGPDSELLQRFTVQRPDGAFDITDWAMFGFGAQIDIQRPVVEKPLDGYAVGTGICAPDAPCKFRLSVLMLLQDIIGDVPVALRYVLDKPDGTRVEGYAQAQRGPHLFSYYRYNGTTWVRLSGQQEKAEEWFVHATWNYASLQ